MPTLGEYRQRTAKELGPFLASTVTAGSSITITDTKWPIYSSLSQDDIYQDQFLYRPDATVGADRERIVKSYDPATGTLMVDTPYAEAPSAGEVYELHGVVQPSVLQECVNTALRRCFIVTEFDFTPTEDAVRHNLTTEESWLTDPDWVRQVGWLGPNDERDECDPYARVVRGFAQKIGDSVWLEHRGRTFDTTDTVCVLALKPSYYHCRASGGEYGEQVGLSLNSDEAVPAEPWVAAGALVEAWTRFGQALEARGTQKILRDREEAKAWFTQETLDHLTVPRLTLRPIKVWGPRY